MQQLESQFSGFDHQHSSHTGFRESEIMGMSGLMDLNRTSGRLNGNSGFDHRRGDSRFDGSSLDVRGGR